MLLYSEIFKMNFKRGDIILVDLNPVKGSEQSGIRPCVIFQNDFANKNSKTFVIAILSSVIKNYPHMMTVQPSAKNGLKNESRIDFLQVRTIDESRVVKKWGSLEKKYLLMMNQKIAIAYGLF